jgi:uracil-DNA glycosylase family protein
MKKDKISAADFLPRQKDYENLKRAAARCRGCPLYAQATQTVFGVGDVHAKLMLVGEQPGDHEDLAGLPFVGPAGELLRRSLEEAGIDFGSLYITNAVKHFKSAKRGALRLHKTPLRSEVNACKPWLMTEIELVRPAVIVCLGATAARALMGPEFKLTRQRGRFKDGPFGSRLMATYHPSAALRAPHPEQREMIYHHMINDIIAAAAIIKPWQMGKRIVAPAEAGAQYRGL